MRKANLLSKEWCDLVFEGRNKRYGAYVLRSKVARWHVLALVVLLGALLLSFFLPFLIVDYVLSEKKTQRVEVTSLSKLEAPKLKEDPELKAVATTRPVKMRVLKKSVRFVPEISNDAPTDELLIGLDSEADALHITPDGKESPGEPEGDTKSEARLSRFPSPVEIVEEMPQFPGGLAALMKWLDKNITYPSTIRHRRLEGEVHVSFIVDTLGNVTEPHITKSINRALDNEVISAVRKMPKWTPGRVGGTPSCVRITIPVVFQLN